MCEANEQIEVAILSALFKSARAKAGGIGNPRASLLRLAMIWVSIIDIRFDMCCTNRKRLI